MVTCDCDALFKNVFSDKSACVDLASEQAQVGAEARIGAQARIGSSQARRIALPFAVRACDSKVSLLVKIHRRHSSDKYTCVQKAYLRPLNELVEVKLSFASADMEVGKDFS